MTDQEVTTGQPADDEQLLQRFPGVAINQDNRAYYLGLLQQQLLLNKCAACKSWHYPPRPMCPDCWSDAVAPEQVSGDGRIHLVVGLPQHNADAERIVVAVELNEQPGLRFTADLLHEHAADLNMIGARVELAWHEVDGAPCPAFRLKNGSERS